MEITKSQLARLQTLYAQFARREIGYGLDRESRLAWASELLQRPITSFSSLRVEDGIHLIDSLQGTLGVREPSKSRPGRAAAHRAGIDGRRDGAEYANSPQIVSAASLGRIERMLEQLGWDQARFELFLASPRSPLARSANKTIRTEAHANKVWWSLKGIAKRQGIWRRTA